MRPIDPTGATWSAAEVPVGSRSRHPIALLGALVIVVLGSCGDGTDTPEFAATTWPDERPVEVTELGGSPVLLAGWATWCVPCERELPALDEFAESPASDGIEIVAVNVDRSDVSDDDLARRLARLDVDLQVWRDTDQTFLAAYDGAMMPYSVLLDRDGGVAASWTGSLNPEGDDFLAAVAGVTG